MERVDADLVPFAQNNPSGYRFAFGTDTATDDINANYNDNIKKGWGTTPNEFPEVEDFNAMAYTSSYLTAYLYQMGISEWNDKQKYRQYSMVIGSDGRIYKAKTGTDLAPNVDNNPTTDTTNWEDVLGNYVATTGNQTIAGVKTFSSDIVGNITGNSATATKLQTARTINGVSFDGSANITVSDSTAVKLTGNQTVAGIKTFSSSPIVPTPITDTQAANKKYVDDSVEAPFVANDTRAKTALNASGTAPIYACRAWVNFNGTGTVAIRASGNISSITDEGIGQYAINFITPMPDTNYVCFTDGNGVSDTQHSSGTYLTKGFPYTASVARYTSQRSNESTFADAIIAQISIFR